jgi:hypothetical protein
MNTSFVIVVRLKDVKALLRKVEDTFAPEIMHVNVEEKHITDDLPLSLQVAAGQDPHDYLDSPLCRIEVFLHRFPDRERDDKFLSQLALDVVNKAKSARILRRTWENQRET